jgi:hypothetical protein
VSAVDRQYSCSFPEHSLFKNCRVNLYTIYAVFQKVHLSSSVHCEVGLLTELLYFSGTRELMDKNSSINKVTGHWLDH